MVDIGFTAYVVYFDSAGNSIVISHDGVHFRAEPVEEML